MNHHSSLTAQQLTGQPDALSEVLQDFRLSGVNYSRCALRHPWNFAVPQQALLRFYFVSEGPCWIHTEAEGWQDLGAGGLVLLPQGVAHRLASAPDSTGNGLEKCQITQHGGNVCEVVQAGEGMASTIFCGSMDLGAYALHPLLNLMPGTIRGCDVATRDPLIMALIEAMTLEAGQADMGGATILSRMADLITARVIRCWVKSHESSATGWLAAIRDPQIGRALAAMHRDPGQNWTLASLANHAGQSRSVFAERFAAILGEGAAHYLARLRMQLAQEWLGQSGMTTADIAARLGYESESSFARAFKRITSQSPGSVRRGSSGRIDMEAGF